MEGRRQATDQPGNARAADSAMTSLSHLFPVQLYSELAPPSCPHCHQPGMELADMMICKASPLRCDTFERLAELGWCRIGDVLFKMKLADICCPTHLARIPVTDFEVTKSHKHVLKKWQKFLLYGDPQWDNPDPHLAIDHKVGNTEHTYFTSAAAVDAETTFLQQDDQTTNSLQNAAAGGRQSETVALDALDQGGSTDAHKAKKAVKPGLGPDPNKPLCRKAKVVKAEKGAAKLGTCTTAAEEKDKGVVGKKTAKPLYKLLDEYEAELQSSSSPPKHKLEIKLLCCNPEDPQITETIDTTFRIYSSHMKAMLPEKAMFESVSEFRWGFVCSPFVSPQGNRPLGTYHLQYYIDGKLEMFSIMDILPESVSPIQTYYNPRLRFISPLLYNILVEIAFIQRLQQENSEMVYYNIGPYNEFSKKVNFKKRYKPMEVRCPVTNIFVPVEKTVPLLQQARYARLAEKDVTEGPRAEELDVDDLICHDFPSSFGPAPFRDFPDDRKKSLKPRLQQYLHEAGEVLKGMLLIIDDTIQLQIKKHMC